MAFSLADRSPDWIATAPVRVERTIRLGATPEVVFGRLGDIATWSDWFKKMRKVRIDGASNGVGALRTVWVETSRVQEHFIIWEPARRLTFNIVSCNTPGLVAMTEDWVLVPDGPSRSLLTITVVAEPIRLLSGLPRLAKAVIAWSTRGAGGIATLFPCDQAPHANHDSA